MSARWNLADVGKKSPAIQAQVTAQLHGSGALPHMAVSQPPIKAPMILSVKPSTDEAKLNRTERAYLAHLRSLGLPWLGIQNITLKLATDTRLTPDFCYVSAAGTMVFVDVKGFQREDALIKMKVAARLFPWAVFLIVKKNGTSWDVTEVDC